MSQTLQIMRMGEQIAELKAEIEKLKYKEENYLQKIEHKDEVIKTLQNRIERMKCCGNCKYKDCNKTSRYQTCWYCKNKDKWELKE